jgi:hypothetical protein
MAEMAAREELGFVTSRSGALIVIDTGYLGIWSHDRPPALLAGELDSEDAVNRANSFVDLMIVEPDAERAGRLLAMSCHPLYVFDQPPDYSELQNKLSDLSREHNLDAGFRVISPRISHRRRANLALEQGGAAEMQFHGVPAVIVGGVPVSVPLRVLGERMPPPDQYQWKRVLLECRAQTPIARLEKVGDVGADYARLLIADIDVLGMWQHERSLDGLADCVFWGRDADRVASKFAAPPIPDEGFGWSDLPEEAAREKAVAVEEYRKRKKLKFVTDYRPHSHHWQVMKPTRNSPTESGVAEIAGMTVCNFMTTRGDGMFEVHRDLGAADELVQLRIELGRETE